MKLNSICLLVCLFNGGVVFGYQMPPKPAQEPPGGITVIPPDDEVVVVLKMWMKKMDEDESAPPLSGPTFEGTLCEDIETPPDAPPGFQPRMVMIRRDLPGNKGGTFQPVGDYAHGDGLQLAINLDSMLAGHRGTEAAAATLLHEYVHARRFRNEEQVNSSPPQDPSPKEDVFGGFIPQMLPGRNPLDSPCEEAATSCVVLRILKYLGSPEMCDWDIGEGEGPSRCTIVDEIFYNERNSKLCAKELEEAGLPADHPSAPRCSVGRADFPGVF